MRPTCALLLISVLIVADKASAQDGAPGDTFTLTSSSVGGQATTREVFDGFGCTGENRSPQLTWAHAPDGTKSFAITMYDPDAPTGSGWWHWVVFDLPATTNGLPMGAGSTGGAGMPKGAVQSMTDFGTTGYGGPCPPPGHGAHRYIVTVSALDAESLGLNPEAPPAMVGYTINSHALARASIVFYYER